MFADAFLLLDCHGWEDFPTHLEGQDAASLWACYTSLWHPCLIAHLESIPRWVRCDQAAPQPNALVLVPAAVQHALGDDILRQWRAQSTLIESPVSRSDIVDRMVDRNARLPCGELQFFALGYAYWQLHLMTCQIRHGGTAEIAQFRETLVAAAKASVNGREPAMREALQQCQDLLLTEKNRYYVSQPRLIDLTVTSSDVSPDSLRRQLQKPLSQANWLIDAETMCRWKQTAPDVLDAVRNASDHGRITVWGGTMRSWPQVLLAIGSVLEDLRCAQSIYTQELANPPGVFARRSGGLHAQLPQILRNFNFSGAVHASFDGSIIARAGHELIEWESPSRDSLPALALQPMDASSAAAFVSLGAEIGKQLNSAHQATALLAHWPDHYHEAWDDLARVVEQSPLLGKWMSAEETLSSGYHPGYGDAFGCDEYRTPILEQAVTAGSAGPISRWSRYWRRTVDCRALEGLASLYEAAARQAYDWRIDIARLRAAIDSAVDNDGSSDEHTIDSELNRAHTQLNDAVTRLFGIEPRAAEGATHRMHVNPTGRARSGVPAWGYRVEPLDSRVPSPPPGSPKPGQSESPMVWSHGLRNDLFELELDQQHGGVLAVRRHGQRGNCLSQRLAWRLDRPGDPYVDTVMEYFECRQENWNRSIAVIQGRFENGADCLGRFSQIVQIEQGSPTITWLIQLDLFHPLSALPWREYICSRLAWSDATARRYADQLETRQPVRLERFTAPLAVEIDEGHRRLALWPNGAAFHRQSAPNILDTLLVVSGEKERTFRLAVSIDPTNAIGAALSWMAPSTQLTVYKPPALPAARWYALKPGNIIVWRHESLVDEQGTLCGATWWVRETAGRDGRLEWEVPHTPIEAKQLDISGELRQSIQPEGFVISVTFRAFEIFGLQCRWQ